MSVVRNNCWPLQDAKARLSELVRRAQDRGPQVVTIHGRESAVVLSAEDYARLKGEQTGKVLVELLAGSPLADVELGRERFQGPVRDVEL